MKRGCHRPLTAKTKHTNLKPDFLELGIARKRKVNKQTLWVDNKSVALCCSRCPRCFLGCFVNPLFLWNEEATNFACKCNQHPDLKPNWGAGGEHLADDNLLIFLPFDNLERQPERRYFNSETRLIHLANLFSLRIINQYPLVAAKLRSNDGKLPLKLELRGNRSAAA